MDYNRQRHKVLKLLSVSKIQFNNGNRNSDFKFGVSYDNLQKELKYDADTCELVYAKLYQEGEVEHTNTAVFGLQATQKGLSSYSEKKYLKENEKLIFDYLRNFVQIAIPIFSLIVAILAIQLKIETTNDKTNKKIDNLQKQLDKQNKIIYEINKK
ncbi:hypothetical protein [Epilithonimonas tenax]|uniref:hypothetical protein n=1 Tax=Epilithonimonas tenax TaxID=191577 RepID=UPI000486CA0D|nr:hypothetical protein [Epilithonimonas tenax]